MIYITFQVVKNLIDAESSHMNELKVVNFHILQISLNLRFNSLV